jgi:hypothetical protein
MIYFYPSKFLLKFLPPALRTALSFMLLFLVSPILAFGGWIWIFICFGQVVRFAFALRHLAQNELCCPSGHHVTIFGKWRCPACHGIWRGPGHRCVGCRAPMNYLVCQNPGCGLATKLPELS